MVFAEFSEFTDKNKSKGFNWVTSHVASVHLNHSTSKSQLTDVIFKLTLIHVPLVLSDLLNLLKTLMSSIMWSEFSATIEKVRIV